MTSVSTEPTLRFEAESHTYIDVDTGEVYKSATQLLVLAGEVDDDFYTEESRHRGTQVHRLTLDYDLGALDVSDCRSRYKPWLEAYVALERALGHPSWSSLEEPIGHRVLKVACTPDRVGEVRRRKGVGEIKSGPRPSPKRRGQPGPHELQTAIQAIVVANRLHLLPEMIARWGFYVKGDGSFKVVEFLDPADIRKAREIIRKFCL